MVPSNLWAQSRRKGAQGPALRELPLGGNETPVRAQADLA